MSKLTLSVNDRVVSRAKLYARRRGVSVSKLVETYLEVLSEPSKSEEDPPVLRALRGSLKRASVRDYRRHLTQKYR